MDNCRVRSSDDPIVGDTSPVDDSGSLPFSSVESFPSAIAQKFEASNVDGRVGLCLEYIRYGNKNTAHTY